MDATGSGGRSGGIYKPLSEADIELIHNRALDLLEEVGMTYETGLDDFLDMVEKAGCRVDRAGQRIFFPRALVTEQVAKSPGRFTMHSRDGANDLDLGADRVHCGSGGTAVRILDLEGVARQSMVTDIHNVARIIEKMDHIHFFQNCCVPHDVPLEDYDLNCVFAAMLGTSKHVMLGCNSHTGLKTAWDMTAEIVGGEDVLRTKPVLSISSCMIISPLKFCTQSLKNAFMAADLDVPTTVTSAPMSGSTAPMTMGGTLLQTHAEELAGITVIQLHKPGARVLYGGLPGMADMRSMGYQGGGVEFGMMNAAIHQLCQRVDVPNYASSGLSDSKIPDAQAGWEKAYTTALAAMGGCNYIHHAAGMLESMLCIAYEQYVIDDEIIGQACRILEGMNLDEDHLAFEAIRDVGPGGNYLLSGHTMRHLRTEYFQGNGVSDKGLRKDWDQAGGLSARQRANARARAILEAPLQACIPAEVEEEIRARFPIHLPARS